MYSGLLPKGLSEADLSSNDSESDTGEPVLCEASQTRASDLFTQEPATKGEIPQTVDEAVQVHSSDECLPGVSEEVWNKFKDLQKLKDKQRQEDSSIKRKRKRRAKKRKRSDPATQKDSNETDKVTAQEKHVDGLKHFFGINDRFEPPACSRPPPMSGLEKTIDTAIAAGDFEKAEELSDKLATRDLAVRIKDAVDCRDYVEAQKKIEASKAEKRRKNLAWGFEAKKRWETKSNMGYM